MAQLIEALAITGSRKSDGSANSSGKLWAYVPGTTTPLTLYADYNAAAPLTQPVALDAGGRATAYLKARADIRLEDSTGALVSTFTYGNRDALVEVVNNGFTGTLASGSQGAGGITDLNTALLALATSAGLANGALDGNFRGVYGTVSTPVWKEIEAVWINAKRFEAVGNGVNDDTTNIQAAINAVSAQGGGICYLPAGTYKISAALTLAAGCILRGAGRVATIIRNTNATGNAITVAGSDAWVDSLAITHSSSSTGDAISYATAAGSDELALTNLAIAAHRRGFAGTVPNLLIERVNITTTTADAAARGVRNAPVPALSRGYFRNCQIAASTGKAIELPYTNGAVLLEGITVSSGAVGVLIGGPGTQGFMAGCIVTATTALDVSAANNFAELGNRFTGTIIPRTDLGGTNWLSYGSGLAMASTPFGSNGSTIDIAAGGTWTPGAGYGNYARVRATSAGTITVAALPTNAAHGTEMVMEFYNNSGGVVTWTMNAIYKLVAAPAPANGQKCTIPVRFDGTDSTWIQSAGSATVVA